MSPERTKDQSITFPSGEALGNNFHMRRSVRIIKSPQWCNPVFGAATERNNFVVASIVYMIKDGDLYSSVDANDILLSLVEWDSEYCMDIPSTFLI